ncbi:hypothetical protein VM1G_07822 [Cytospora mali]|uniref:Uncharacterized protein n=1 Tax=Cytospora mali TaxID=578113 RepID=A0A194W6Q4_CYTMA|nr:hypothetical protein VM1G_07822 [Valsa mali]
MFSLVLKFIYGAGTIGPRLSHFQHEKDSTDHLGNYLSTKLMVICVVPIQRAKRSFHQNRVIQELKNGILAADRSWQLQQDHDLPYKMLVDFVVAGREIILRDETLQRNISHDNVPPGFIMEVMLTQYRDKCQTASMEDLMGKPMKLLNKPRLCTLCRSDLDTDEGAHYNPWPHDPLKFVYTQVCCFSCAHSADYRDEDGMFSWSIFTVK